MADPIRVLVLTFNRTLRGYIDQLASEQVTPTSDLVLTVDTFSHWAQSLIGFQTVIEGNGAQWIRPMLTDTGIPAENLDYFAGEVTYVLGRFTSDQRDMYLEATRSGRGRAPAVPRALRIRLLDDVIGPYEARKLKAGWVDWNDVALIAARQPSQRYDIVIVDESQDLSANQMRTVMAHLSDDHVTTFIIDAMQRIYPQGFQWSELGINMRPEMVFTLASNHRNTAEIARLASSIVRGLPSDDDGMLPDDQECQRSGERPKVIAGLYSAQVNYMLDSVQPHIASGDAVGILHPKGWFNYTRDVLSQRGIDYCELTRESEWPTGPELLALSTLHSSKGLEFDHVLLPGLSDEATPHGNEDGDGTLDSLRRLTAMGIGRARKTVMLGYKPGEQSTVFESMDPETYDLVEV